MSRLAVLAFATLVGAGGFWLGGHPQVAASALDEARAYLSGSRSSPGLPQAAVKPAGTIAYYRDPDGKLSYSADPRKTADRRDFVAVDAAADVRFGATGTIMAANSETARPPVVEASGRKIRFYRNPMGLPDTSPVPKKDSMGMDYIAVYAGEEEDGKTIRVSPGKLQRTGVQSVKVDRRPIMQTVRVPGSVQLDERLISVVATRSDAYVDHVENVTTGDTVKKGQPLVTVYSPDVNSAAAQMISNPGYEGSRRRLKNLNVSDEAIADMERTHQVPFSIMWSAPRGGVVLERGAVEGMKAAAGATLFRIADISTVWVLADVPEHAIGGVRVGQAANVRVRALPNRAFSGRIALIYPQLNNATRSTRVRIELPNPDHVLLADMYADVEIATGTPTPVIAVPDDAVIDTGARQTVILDRGDGRLEPRGVKVGVRGDGYVEVKDGVAVGDAVVTSANFLIDAESNLKAALEGMTAGNTQAERKP
ncbi:efflux RND transporter periplasmic adaptor subunit [Beijerinckia sp. L45]|uniref:efflux RND transporter periplasmic adaptor subunit n=1 Tax=Beijerinckia sp. L45 TaxID=1641855 RepID=UPI001FEDA2AA|nr:efflux RND transporter periplasmic adaptor subunit [Beijerinckia sp. L45]